MCASHRTHKHSRPGGTPQSYTLPPTFWSATHNYWLPCSRCTLILKPSRSTDWCHHTESVCQASLTLNPYSFSVEGSSALLFSCRYSWLGWLPECKESHRSRIDIFARLGTARSLVVQAPRVPHSLFRLKRKSCWYPMERHVVRTRCCSISWVAICSTSAFP